MFASRRGLHPLELYYKKPSAACYGGSSLKDYSVDLRIAGYPWILSGVADPVWHLAVRSPLANDEPL
jgi:hypothetical protein